jgi:glycosyltransferase involved in cell wall biosynthesis
MRIAIDSGPLSSTDATRGIGFHTKELVAELEKLQNDDFKFDVVDFSKTDLSKYDIAHFQSFNPYRTALPFFKPAKKVVVTIHDLIYLIYPKAYPPGIRGRLNFYLQKFNLRNVDAVITISETSKKDIVRFLNINPNKIFVTYLAPQSEVKTQNSKATSYELPKKFVLYIGDVNYNKNLLNLAKACKIAKLKLVIVGRQSVVEQVGDNIENRPWKEFLKLYKEDRDILRLGFVENLDEIFKKATLYCQPSLYEGFGLPLLEAFQRNVPVVASRTQALVEVGNDACLYVDPNDPENIARGLKEVVDNKKLSVELVKKGRLRLNNFSWKKTANDTLNVYKQVTNLP